MISLGVGLAFIAFILVATEPVTELPFGLETPAQFLADTMHALQNSAPWLEPIFTVFLIGIVIKIGMWVFDMYLKVVQILRGGGSV